MEVSTAVSLSAVTVVLATLSLTGPAVGLIDPGSDATELGEGTATVDGVTLEGDPVVTAGRFGTDVAYFRVPDATVRLSSVTGHSRLVYTVSISALDFERVGNRPPSPDASRSVTVGMADRAFTYGTIHREAYEATLAVRVQSFAVDRTVYRENATVEVRTDE
jgi:hypothetical protein